MESGWPPLIRDFGAWMKYRNLAVSTQRIYTNAVTRLATFLGETEANPAPDAVKRRDIEAFVTARLAQVKPASVSADFRALQQFFKWLEGEEEIERNPILGMRGPLVPEQPVAVLEVEQLRALLDSVKSNDLVSRRDNAIIRLLVDTGGRLSEIADIKVDDVDFDMGVCHVLGKGRRERALPFGQATALALGRYMRVRAKDPQAALPALWLSERQRGAFNSNGIHQMLGRRGESVGITGLHAHLFRHTFAHRWLAEGGGETDLMRLAGWKSSQMLRRYGASKADERARDSHRKMGLGDKL
jgi:integrase/recombinase XerC